MPIATHRSCSNKGKVSHRELELVNVEDALRCERVSTSCAAYVDDILITPGPSTWQKSHDADETKLFLRFPQVIVDARALNKAPCIIVKLPKPTSKIFRIGSKLLGIISSLTLFQ